MRREFESNVSRDQLELSSKATMEQRLQWLEEMQNFIYAAVPVDKIKRWQEYKQQRHQTRDSKPQTRN